MSGPARSPRLEEESGLDEETTLGLLRRLLDELATLFRQELALAAAEVKEMLGKLAVRAVSAAVAGTLLFAGLLVLLAAAVLGLSLVVAPWLAALIVGAAVIVAGLLVLLLTRKPAEAMTAELRRSRESLRKDKQVLSRSAS